MPTVAIVVPCYNEANRLELPRFATLLERAGVRLVFVDDGSTDDTLKLLRRFATLHARVDVVAATRNGGKGEAVRVGMRRAIADGAEFVGFSDADLATPPEELLRLVGVAVSTRHDAVLGSRVARAGASIERRPTRHYLGRVFATYASLVLGASIYDTQCGAKFFRVTPTLARALEEPFVSRWVFDVELLGRLAYDPVAPVPESALLEVPLDAWRDVAGSHIRVTAVPRIAADIVRATRSLGGLRRAARRGRPR